MLNPAISIGSGTPESGMFPNTSSWEQLISLYTLNGLEVNFCESELNQHHITLEEYFQKNPPRTATEASAVIEELTGIKRSPTQVRGFMKKLGMKPRKIGYVPGKATNPDKIEEQEQFQKETLNYGLTPTFPLFAQSVPP